MRIYIAIACWLMMTISLANADSPSKDRFIQTDAGAMRYQIHGLKGNPSVVLIHSFNGYLESWQPNIKSLVDSGYFVVTYDLWGRGLSSHLTTDLSLDVFVEQLTSLLDSLNISQTNLVGASFGAVIATEYALRFEQRIEKLILVGPAGWPTDEGLSRKLIQVPILADIIFYANGKGILRKKVLEYFYHQPASWALAHWDRYADISGFTRSSLSILRHSPVADYTHGWKRLGQSGKQSLFIWGKQDVSFPHEHTKQLEQWIPNAKLYSVDKAAHWLNIENAEQVNQQILVFLAEQGS